MATIKILAGDLPKGKATALFGQIVIDTGDGFLSHETIAFTDIEEVDIASESSAIRIGGAAGWGAAGAVLMGPLGLLAGMVLGGKGSEKTFVARLRDGRKFMGSTDAKTYAKLLAATM